MGIQPDGKIVVAASNEDVHLARYNTDGSLSGTVITTDVGGITDDVDSLTIDTSGGVLVAGSTNTAGNIDFFVAKYLVNGGLDTAFDNGDGIVITPLGSNSDLAHSVAFQGSKIIVAGSNGEFGSKKFALVRYLGLQPTAASVSVTGRITDGYGRGIRGVSVSLTNAQGTTLYAMTSSFGYYSFSNVQVGQTYILSPRSTRYTFTPNALVISLMDEYTGADFVSSFN